MKTKIGTIGFITIAILWIIMLALDSTKYYYLLSFMSTELTITFIIISFGFLVWFIWDLESREY